LAVQCRITTKTGNAFNGLRKISGLSSKAGGFGIHLMAVWAKASALFCIDSSLAKVTASGQDFSDGVDQA